ncbi:MAG: septum formation initiator family protein [Cellulosilyticaceae bacterium]
MRNHKKIVIRISALLTLIIMVGLGVRAIEVQKITKEIDHQIEDTKIELKKEKEELQSLEEEKKEMNTPAYIEKVAREKLGMVKADDVVIKEKKNNE